MLEYPQLEITGLRRSELFTDDIGIVTITYVCLLRITTVLHPSVHAKAKH